MTNTKRDPKLIAEAAMCLWESMLEARPDEPLVSTLPAWRTGLARLWDIHGTVEMRHYAYRLALDALDVYDALGADWLEEHDLIPYDWEFIPAVLRQADWTCLEAADNRPERLVEAIRQSVTTTTA